MTDVVLRAESLDSPKHHRGDSAVIAGRKGEGGGGGEEEVYCQIGFK